MTVNVTDDGSGTLSASASATKSGDGLNANDTFANNTAQFTNKYEVTSANVSFSVTKTMTGSGYTPDANKTFTFHVHNKGNTESWMTDGTQSADTVDLTTTGDVTDDTATFSNISIPSVGTYYFLIHEDKPANAVSGVTYDSRLYLVRIEATDNGQGGLTLTKSYKTKASADATESGWNTLDNSFKFSFTNAYCTNSVTHTLTATKTVSGRPAIVGSGTTDDPEIDPGMPKGGEFRFTITATTDVVTDGYTINGSETVSTTANSSSVTFPTITFSKAGTSARRAPTRASRP